jgi:hypothetical protein
MRVLMVLGLVGRRRWMLGAVHKWTRFWMLVRPVEDAKTAFDQERMAGMGANSVEP